MRQHRTWRTASPTVDTSAAGANVVLADGSANTVTGSHVARIYKEGTTDKLHKYDGAFYSKMSMNVERRGGGHRASSTSTRTTRAWTASST